MLRSFARALTRWPLVQQKQALQHAGRTMTTQSERTMEEINDDSAQFPPGVEDFVGIDLESESKPRYNFENNLMVNVIVVQIDLENLLQLFELLVAFIFLFNNSENHIEVTGIVRGPPRVYTMPTGRQYAIVKLSTTAVDRRGSGRFVSFIDVFAPHNIVDYIKDHVREGVQVYASGQLRSRMRTDEDGRPFQDVRIQASGLFKIVEPKHAVDNENVKNIHDTNLELKESHSGNVAETRSAK
ncbi:unnamed protein product [Thelazia callipaeda]|uniref:Single-stranded DNA-binding protein, mitochondrial n=1 Tax=Thelazia callipaeda TaxID=103827 RepID=A0A0N5D7S0_THECL|nr:unnamed protein product [Thelazia callipaeda]